MGDVPARRFCAPPGVSGSDLVLMLATALPALGKVPSAIDFKAMQLPCVVLCVFHYTKRRPAEHICIKLPVKQRLRKRCHFKNHLCIFIQSTMLTLWTYIQRTHTLTRPRKEGNASENPRWAKWSGEMRRCIKKVIQMCFNEHILWRSICSIHAMPKPQKWEHQQVRKPIFKKQITNRVVPSGSTKCVF